MKTREEKVAVIGKFNKSNIQESVTISGEVVMEFLLQSELTKEESAEFFLETYATVGMNDVSVENIFEKKQNLMEIFYKKLDELGVSVDEVLDQIIIKIEQSEAQQA